MRCAFSAAAFRVSLLPRGDCPWLGLLSAFSANYMSWAGIHLRTELTRKICFARRRSGFSMTPSEMMWLRRRCPRKVPARRPQVTGGVMSLPSISTTTFATVDSVISPRSFQRITSSQSGRVARAKGIFRTTLGWRVHEIAGGEASLAERAVLEKEKAALAEKAAI